MQVSKIEDKMGGKKQLMSKFPMKGVKPNWLMVASGSNTTT